MSQNEPLTISGLRVRTVDAPLSRPIRTGGGALESSPLVLIDLFTDQGVTGSSYLFAYTRLALAPLARLVENLGVKIRGEPVVPLELDRKLRSLFRLLGPQGLTGMAMAGIDMAAWDALAKAARLPLCRLLGGEPRAIPAYNSCGLGLMGAARAAVEARELVAPGFRAIKARLGYSDLTEDLAVVRSIRAAIGPDPGLMVDYNQCLSVPEAIDRARALDGEGLVWIEEPTDATDYDGHARIRGRARTPIQAGENWWGTSDMARSIAAGASDFAMLDVGKIGGVTGWLRASALADAAGLPVSSHLFPEISAHLLAVTPTRHWLEYIEMAAPLLLEPLRVEDGSVVVSSSPGAGIAWDEAAVERYSVA